MHRIAAITAGLLSIAVLSGAASAADLAPRTYTKAPAMAPVYNWGGLLHRPERRRSHGAAIAGNVTRAVGGTPPAAPSEGCARCDRVALAGGQIGYRWQTTNWVFGVEAQGDWADLKGSNTSSTGTFAGLPFSDQTKINAIGLFTGQVGYAWNNVLWYVKGGAAVDRRQV